MSASTTLNIYRFSIDNINKASTDIKFPDKINGIKVNERGFMQGDIWQKMSDDERQSFRDA